MSKLPTKAIAVVSNVSPLDALNGKPLPLAKGNTSNMLKLPTQADVKEQADLAWSDDVKGRALLGPAEQRQAYVTLCEHARMVIASDATPSLNSCITSKDAKSDMMAKMVDIFIPPLPATDNKDGEDNKAAVASFLKHKQLVKRGLELAAILAAFNVSFLSFNRETGLFSVPVAMLKVKDTTPVDRLAEASILPLDGSTIIFYGKDKAGKAKPMSAQCSVAHVRLLHMPTATPRTPNHADGDTAKATGDMVVDGATAKVPEIAKAIPLAKLIGAAYNLMITTNPDKGKPIKRDALSEATWTQLSAIMHLVDASQQSWAKDAATAQGKQTILTPAAVAAKAKVTKAA